MMQCKIGISTLTITALSRIGSIQEIIQRAGVFVRERTDKPIDDVLIVLRELVSNGITHGNKNNLNLLIAIRIEDLGNNTFMVKVSDQGNGFDYKGLETKIPQNPHQITKRGFLLIHAISDDIVFSEKGNAVGVTVRLTEEQALTGRTL